MDGFRFLDLNDCNTSLSELPSDIDLPGDGLDQLSAGDVPRLVPGGAEPWPADPQQYLADYQARRTAEWQDYYCSPGDPVTALELEEYFRRLQQ
jgi:hypothetical protein